VNIPSSVTSIGSCAFCGCTGLTSVAIPSSVTSIGSSAFYGCTGLTSVAIPSSVTSIGSSAFYGCTGLTSVAIPSSVASIGSSAFYGCTGLTSVTVMKEMPVTIYVSTFSNRTNATLYVPEGCKAAYEAADYWKEFKEIVELLDEENYLDPTDMVACRGGQITLPLSMNNVEQIVGFQFDLQLPEGVTIATNANGTFAASFTDRASDHSLSVSKVEDNLYRFVSVSMNNNAYTGTEGALLNVKLKVDESVAVGDYDIKVINTELTTADKTVINSVDGTAMLTVQEADPGDVNGDGRLSFTDVTMTINNILGREQSGFDVNTADMNGDGRVTITDAVIIINNILKQGQANE